MKERNKLLFLLNGHAVSKLRNTTADNNYFCCAVEIAPAIAAPCPLYEGVRRTDFGKEHLSIKVTADFDSSGCYQQICRAGIIIEPFELLVDPRSLLSVKPPMVKEYVLLGHQP